MHRAQLIISWCGFEAYPVSWLHSYQHCGPPIHAYSAITDLFVTDFMHPGVLCFQSPLSFIKVDLPMLAENLINHV